ncbi:hypothetical protein [Sphingomonas sp.]|uniref:hypothetical protein n=1 Tax=Sphingomonas sp. TaxID=28214 RepID=UPI002DF5F466|nr:hypothetical protein [Sphingomonas sp.]
MHAAVVDEGGQRIAYFLRKQALRSHRLQAFPKFAPVERIAVLRSEIKGGLRVLDGLPEEARRRFR